MKIADTEFADDMALASDSVEELGVLFREIEEVSATVGLLVNRDKTQFLVENIPQPEPLLNIAGESIEEVQDFKYLGSWIRSSEKEVNVRKAKAWAACHKLKRIWKTDMCEKLKARLFVATVETVLLYGCESWTLSKQLEKNLNGTYTKMLRMALDKDQWALGMTNATLYGYGDLPILSSKIRERRLRLAGHAQRHPEIALNSVLLWEPAHGKANRGRRKLTFTDILKKDVGVDNCTELASLMMERDCWRNCVHRVREFYST